jgi:hypothetical protein
MIESGIAAFQVAMLSFASPDLLQSLPILAEALEGGATAAVEEAAAAENEATTVYQSVNPAGNVNYVGITNNLE